MADAAALLDPPTPAVAAAYISTRNPMCCAPMLQGMEDPHTVVTVNHLRSYENMGQAGRHACIKLRFIWRSAVQISCISGTTRQGPWPTPAAGGLRLPDTWTRLPLPRRDHVPQRLRL